MSQSECAERARRILRGESPPEPREMYALARELMKEKNFTYARRILNRAMLDSASVSDPKLRVKIRQQAAVSTYKDTDLPADERLNRALDILSTCEPLSESRSQETLGLAGAIYKRKWEVDSQRQQLERSLFYYLRGYAMGAPPDRRADIFGYIEDIFKHHEADLTQKVTTTEERDDLPPADYGYTGINAAYVLDVLAHQEEKEAVAASFDSGQPSGKRDKARLIRREIIRALLPVEDAAKDKQLKEWKKAGRQGEPTEPALGWWFYVTLGEAYFGVGDYAKAEEWLITRAAGVAKAAWEEESTARQLVSLVFAQSKPDISYAELEKTAGWQTLRKFLKGDAHALRSAAVGKIGLGLSGGGFRASLYHIGVLAKLAELDVLRGVEVISCVSGGSIIGAHYYLELRKLLREKRDAQSTEEYRSTEPYHKRDHVTYNDYLDIVARISEDFLAGVQRNIRTRVGAEFFTNLRMIFGGRYSRTLRAGELYESEIYSRVKDNEGQKKRYISDLYITPKEYEKNPSDFSPKNDNWHRGSKVPALILNAATLNTGHTWHFTASYMGEPPAGIDADIDGNDRYRRMYYSEAPESYKQVRLGHAVAASACVPGLFEPVAFDKLFPDRTVRLVDGGTCDNQGVGGLLEQDSTVVLISDGSGQMESQNMPSAGLLGVPLRSVSIVQARVREAQYNELNARRRSGLLRGLMFVHLKSDLDVDPVDWLDCQDPFDASDDARPIFRRGPLTRYGIAKKIQGQLAAVRTDLDSFSEAEAFALMTSGYRQTEQAFRQKCVRGFEEPGEPVRWRFLDVEDGMRVPGEEYRRLQKLLGVSPSRAFKVWMLSPVLKAVAAVLGVALVAFVVYAFWQWSDTVVLRTITFGGLGLFLLSYVLTQVGKMVLGEKAMLVVKLRSTLTRIAVGIGVALLGWIAARIHLHIFDRLFLRMGRVREKPKSRHDDAHAATPPAPRPAPDNGNGHAAHVAPPAGANGSASGTPADAEVAGLGPVSGQK